MRKRILVFSPPFSGHLNVLKSFIRHCQGIYDIKLIITGWSNIPADLSSITADVISLNDIPLQETDPALWTFQRVLNLAERCLAIARDFKPDILIYDFFSLEAVLVGETFGMPYWSSIPALPGPFVYKEYLKEKLAQPVVHDALNALNVKYGNIFDVEKVEMISDGLHVPGELNLLWSYPSLLPENMMLNRQAKEYVCIGSLAGDRIAKRTLEGKPIIFISFGTVVMNNIWNQQPEIRAKLQTFFTTLAERWGTSDLDVIFVTQGKTVLDSYPQNWRVVEKINQVEALARSSVFVTHGGANSFHEAVLARIPMVAIPFFGDQPLVAQQIERLGIGLDMVQDAGIDTRKSKDFLDADLVGRVDSAVRSIIASYNTYQKAFDSLPLEAQDIITLLKNRLA